MLLDTDVEGALKRVNGSEELYVHCLRLFLEDKTITELNEAVEQKNWEGAFTAVHALKGLAGNMGFVPLMHTAAQLVITIRAGKTKELNEHMAYLNSYYRKITDVIYGKLAQNGEL